MAPAAPQLPTRFPCWCRAVYSWGGETKRDLGFVEGDLIECLNAGDGQWWMGRLRRDRRMAGLFPSNFVEVLGEDFVPVSSTSSQMVKAGPSPITNPTSAPKKQKTVFRKPFQAHKEALAPSAELARSTTNTASVTSSIPRTPPRHGSLPRGVKPLRTPATAVKHKSSLGRPSSQSNSPSRGVSPRAYQESQAQASIPARHESTQARPPSRAVSPRPPFEPEMASPAPIRQNLSVARPPSRGVSPRPTTTYDPDIPPAVPIRHNSAQPQPLTRAVSPRPMYEPEIPPAVPIRHNSVQPRPPSRAVSPRPMYEPEVRPVAPIRHSYMQPQSPSRAVSPRPIYEPEVLPIVPIRHNSVQPRPPSRAVSPHPTYEPEIPSPVEHGRQLVLARPGSREISPLQLQERDESPPPPPPPPHRVAVNRPPSPSRDNHLPAPFDMNDRYMAISRTPSPAARSDANGQTPSPLRDAMEDVMTSLEDMGMPREDQSPSPSPVFNNPWSPDAYDSFRGGGSALTPRRPLTSLGFDGDKDYEQNPVPVPAHRNSVYTHDHYIDGPPQLNNYVQRMESRLRQMQENRRGSEDVQFLDNEEEEEAPPPPPKNVPYHGRHNSIPAQYPHLRGRRSGQDLRGDILNRSYTNKSSTTNSSSGVQSNGTNMTASTERTSQSLMSGPSAGGFSATSAGSYARRGVGTNERPNTAMDTFRSRGFSDVSRVQRPETPLTGVSYHSSHNTSRQGASSAIPWSSSGNASEESPGILGGLTTPKAKKQGFFKKIFESAKTGAASARSSIAVGQNGGSYSPTKGRAVSPIPTPNSNRDTARDMGLGSSNSIDWVQVRRDVNRASSPSRNERIERAERCQMMDHPVIYAVEELYETAEGDESIDGLPISEPTNFGSVNLTLVDKSARFVNSLPPMTNPMSLSQGYICRPYKSDVQRLRAIFTWVSEKISWDDPVDEMDVDLRRVLQTKRGSPQEVAYLVKEMCAAVGIHAETVKGYVKSPGELFELDSLSRPNHWWNSVLVDGEWRVMDCSLASPTNPRRNQFVTNLSSNAESWYFLARPTEVCYTHVPLYPEEQHICPPISPDVLLALPTTCPPYFKLGVQFPDYDTSIIRIDGLEVLQIRLLVPPDVECAAEVEAPAFACDADGDYFESGEIVRKRSLVQPDWVNGQKRFTVKAVLPGDEGQGTLKVYAGKKGLMHSSRDIPHPLALALPIIHTGDNPSYDFVLRHPTPHAQRHDLYIMQPQCSRLAVNNTFVFAVRQHPSAPPFSSQGHESISNGRISPSVFARPASALSMVSSSAGGSSVSTVSNEFSASTSAISSRSGSGREKPAKLAIQSPSGKILRLTRKADHMIGGSNNSNSPSDATADGSVWETVIKIGERGVWRGLVLADRVARWCVFCEWECF